jgi:hypothetical protein
LCRTTCHILAWSDQPYNSGYQDKLSISCMYTWWLDNNRDYLFEYLFVKTECWNHCFTEWLGSTNIQKFLESKLGIPSNYLSLGCGKHLKIKTRRENKHWTGRIDSQLRRVVLIFSEKNWKWSSVCYNTFDCWNKLKIK